MNFEFNSEKSKMSRRNVIMKTRINTDLKELEKSPMVQSEKVTRTILKFDEKEEAFIIEFTLKPLIGKYVS